ncbi:MAG: VanZ family protein [Candidatus Binatia bacterium]
MRRFLRYWLPAILWALFILLLSGEMGQSRITLEIVRAVLLFVLPSLDHTTVELVHTILRKLAHVVVYAIFTLLLYRAFQQDAAHGRWGRWALFSALLALGVAGLDEFHQAYQLPRTGSALDVGLNAVGVFLGQGILVWKRYRERVQSRYV